MPEPTLNEVSQDKPAPTLYEHVINVLPPEGIGNLRGVSDGGEAAPGEAWEEQKEQEQRTAARQRQRQHELDQQRAVAAEVLQAAVHASRARKEAAARRRAPAVSLHAADLLSALDDDMLLAVGHACLAADVLAASRLLSASARLHACLRDGGLPAALLHAAALDFTTSHESNRCLGRVCRVALSSGTHAWDAE